jgi:hypothetical protein
MDPGFKIFNLPPYFYNQLRRKNSKLLKYPKHKRSSRLCLIAADRDSLRDLKHQDKGSFSMDSKTSNTIQILDFTNTSEKPQELKVESNSQNPKEMSLGKIIIKKSSRIKESIDSKKKLVTSEILFPQNQRKDSQNLYWTKNRKKEKVDETPDRLLGYSTLDRSRIIEVSDFPTNPNGMSLMDMDSVPRKFFRERVPSNEKEENVFNKQYPLTPKAPKTSLSDLSRGSDRMIQDFLDRQITKNKNPGGNKWEEMNLLKVKNSPESVTLSMKEGESQGMSSLNIDEKTETGFTFNIFKNQNLVKSEIFDMQFGTISISNYETQNSKPKSTVCFVRPDEVQRKKNLKKKGKEKKKETRTNKKFQLDQLKLTKTPKRKKVSNHAKIKSSNKTLHSKRSTKSNTKGIKKKKLNSRKVLPIGRQSVNLANLQSFNESMKFNKKKKSEIKKKKPLNFKLKKKRLTHENQFSEKEVTNLKYFKRSKLKHKRTMSGVDGMIGNFTLGSNRNKDLLLLKTSQKNKTKHKGISKEKQKSKSIKPPPKKNLKICVTSSKNENKTKKSKKKIKMSETPIYRKSTKKLTFDHFG